VSLVTLRLWGSILTFIPKSIQPGIVGIINNHCCGASLPSPKAAAKDR
jgi:hypothetical protein